MPARLCTRREIDARRGELTTRLAPVACLIEGMLVIAVTVSQLLAATRTMFAANRDISAPAKLDESA